MHIKSVIIDGFKSYGNRVEINGFDPQFNAITGLNGTGKSNILDAICFVLGISNLSQVNIATVYWLSDASKINPGTLSPHQVRATSLTDLVYKCGQAGIKKASVTIVFDNRDRSRSPAGFESYEEITVTRQIFVSNGLYFWILNLQPFSECFGCFVISLTSLVETDIC